MIEWPPNIQTPDAGLVFRACINRFGSEYHGKAMATAVTVIYTKEVIYENRTRRDMWTTTAALCGVKKDALQQAYQRSGNKKWARFLAAGLINELVRQQTR